MDGPPVAIIGGGIGGLTAALALLQRGIDVIVYEQAGELRVVGAGLQISANGTRVLHALGLAAGLERTQAILDGKEIRHWRTGETWKLFDLGAESVSRYGYPYINVHRGDLHALLVDAVRARKPDAIRLGMKCAGISQTNHDVTIAFASGETAQAGIVIGADGIHSAVRQSVFGAELPEYSGIVAWRALVSTEHLPLSMRRLVGTNWVGPGAHVVHYPLRGGQLLNFVGLAERPEWTAESWIEPGTAEGFAQAFAGWHPDVLAAIHSAPAPTQWALIGRPPMDPWSHGRITLLGDACHPSLPFLAQGAVMALEDGYVLARCLEKYPGDHATAFAIYEAARKERTARAVLGAADNAKRFHNPTLADPAGAEAYIAREWQEERIRQRYEWLFVYDATTVPI
jgi:salicylate hydroxylase